MLSPSEQGVMLVAPSEAVDKAFISRHFIPVSVIIIPIVVRSTRKDEINPRGGCFGRAFLNNLDS